MITCHMNIAFIYTKMIKKIVKMYLQNILEKNQRNYLQILLLKNKKQIK